jgi:hypothetical protein
MTMVIPSSIEGIPTPLPARYDRRHDHDGLLDAGSHIRNHIGEHIGYAGSGCPEEL